jgi:hypothetical protein
MFYLPKTKGCIYQKKHEYTYHIHNYGCIYQKQNNMHISTRSFSMDVYTKKNNMIISTKNISMDVSTKKKH